jgi:hypothetical protein
VVVGMMLVSNRSNRRDRPLLIIFVVSGSLESMTSSWMRPEALSKRLNSLPLVLHPRPFGGGNGEESSNDKSYAAGPGLVQALPA